MVTTPVRRFTIFIVVNVDELIYIHIRNMKYILTAQENILVNNTGDAEFPYTIRVFKLS